MVYFPRRAYDLWNTRYIIVPFDADGWRDPTRASAPFLFQTQPGLSRSRRLRSARKGPSGPGSGPRPATSGCYATWRSTPAPGSSTTRARRSPSPSLSRGRRGKTMQEILYAPDPVWHDASQPVYDPRSLAWVEHDDLAAIRPYLSGQTTGASETVRGDLPQPEQAVLEVRLDSPGLVVLADRRLSGLGAGDRRQTGARLSGERCDARSRGLLRPASAGLHVCAPVVPDRTAHLDRRPGRPALARPGVCPMALCTRRGRTGRIPMKGSTAILRRRS